MLYENSPGKTIYSYFSMSRGILYFILILLDPQFIRILKLWKSGQKIDEAKDNHPVNAFLCSSMNLELVTAILQGIKDSVKKSVIEAHLEGRTEEVLKIQHF